MISFLRVFEIGVGFYYLVFGLDGFFKKIPLPEPAPRALEFLKNLENVKYIFFIVKWMEIIVGLSWIFGVGSGLAWILFTPIWLNIVFYHLLLNRREIVLPTLVIGAHVLLAIKNWDYLKTVFVFGIQT